jgi:hypothetical protein
MNAIHKKRMIHIKTTEKNPFFKLFVFIYIYFKFIRNLIL